MVGQVKASFSLVRITSEITKRDTVISMLDHDIAKMIPDKIRNPDPKQPYTKLKKCFLALFG